MRGIGAWILTASLAAPAQTVIDRPIIVVAGEVNTVVTALDVREARLLHLVDAAGATDIDVAQKLADRRLMLVEVRRSPLFDPDPAARAERLRVWQAANGTAEQREALLARAGVTEAGLEAWLRDDLRLEAYINRQFATLLPVREMLLQYYREHEAEFTRNGVLLLFDDVQAELRAKVAQRNRADAVAKWIAGLRERAQITVIKGS